MIRRVDFTDLVFHVSSCSHVPSYIYIRIYSRIRHNIALGYRHQLYFFFFVFFSITNCRGSFRKKKKEQSARSTGRQLFFCKLVLRITRRTRESESRTMRNNEAPVTSTIRFSDENTHLMLLSFINTHLSNYFIVRC